MEVVARRNLIRNPTVSLHKMMMIETKNSFLFIIGVCNLFFFSVRSRVIIFYVYSDRINGVHFRMRILYIIFLYINPDRFYEFNQSD